MLTSVDELDALMVRGDLLRFIVSSSQHLKHPTIKTN